MARPFQGINGANQIVTASSTSDSITINAASQSVRVINFSSNMCHIRIGVAPQTATSADTPVLPSQSLILRKADGDDTIAYISEIGATLHIQPGENGV